MAVCWGINPASWDHNDQKCVVFFLFFHSLSQIYSKIFPDPRTTFAQNVSEEGKDFYWMNRLLTHQKGCRTERRYGLAWNIGKRGTGLALVPNSHRPNTFGHTPFVVGLWGECSNGQNSIIFFKDNREDVWCQHIKQVLGYDHLLSVYVANIQLISLMILGLAISYQLYISYILWLRNTSKCLCLGIRHSTIRYRHYILSSCTQK